MSSVANMGDYLPRNKKSATAAKTGYIKLFRTIRRQSWYKDSDACHLWIEMLLTANHKPQVVDASGQAVAVGRGQLMTSLSSLEKHTGIGRETIRRKLAMFEKDGQIKWQSTNRWRLITILTFDDYQGENPSKTSAKTAQKTDRQNDTLNSTQSDRLKATAGAVVSDIATGNSTGKTTGKTTPNKNGNNIILPNGSCQNSDELCPDQPEDSESIIKPCPHAKIIDLYHETLPELPKVLKPRWNGSARARDLQARWKESPQHQSREFWQAYFSAVRKIPHQMGNNDRGWKADLGWLVKRGNFDKMVEKFVNQGLWK